MNAHPFTRVLAAVDLGPLTGRVLYHAAGLAAVLDAKLKIIHVVDEATTALQGQVVSACLAAAPYRLPIDESDVVLGTGSAASVIAQEAASVPGTLIVAGSSGHGRFMKLLLGSTTDSLLAQTHSPILLVPPTSFDIVNAGDGAAITCGPVIAAVDLAESNPEQLRAASHIAARANSPLYLLTVARTETDHDASEMLRDRGHHLEPQRPKAMIVRHGNVADEISRAAVSEGSGLVVMGLRDRGRGRPGVIAASVLQTGRAFVLAVPAEHG